MCIRMLQILNSGRCYKKEQLAYLLDTNIRNINEYRKEINEIFYETYGTCGYFIDNISGPNGGYVLNGQAILPSFSLTESEKGSLIDALNYLMSRNDFIAKKEYALVSAKILSSIVIDSIKKDDDLMVINRYPLVVNQEEIERRAQLIRKAIKDKKSIQFKYLSQKNTEKERLLDPYEIFMYNNAWYVIGWLHSKNSDVIPFKINRMSDIEITNDSYSLWKFYKRSDYVDEFGFKKNGDWFHVVFVAKGTYASLCKERIYGKNQVVDVIDRNSTKVSVDMQNKDNIKSFLLGFGEDVDVLEPDWLKEEIKAVAKAIFDKY